MSKRFMKNTNTGVVFSFDEAQVADDKKPYMVECNADGEIVYSGAEQVTEVQTLRRQVAELTAKINSGGSSADDSASIEKLQEENALLTARLSAAGEVAANLATLALYAGSSDAAKSFDGAISDLLAVTDRAEKGSPIPVIESVVFESESGPAVAPVEYTADQIDALKEQARALKIRGFTKMQPDELVAAIEKATAAEE
ncbi:MAG: hypothetical protein JXR25_11855 [Pontiellaceae bacterium]|nr:hypothetical protein [Pontiellaceae bacterium]